MLVAGNLAALTIGVLLIGLTSWVPTFVEGVLGSTALVAGFAIGALTLGWPVAAGYSGRIYLRIGFRDTALGGSALVVAGAVLLVQLDARSAVWEVAGACLLMGLGFGFSASPTVVAIQSVVGWDRRGVVTATHMFSRAIGSAIGAAVFGAIGSATLDGRGPEDAAALSSAAENVFTGVLVVTALTVVALLLMPRRTVPLVFDT
jgi:MFS family permease